MCKLTHVLHHVPYNVCATHISIRQNFRDHTQDGSTHVKWSHIRDPFFFFFAIELNLITMLIPVSLTMCSWWAMTTKNAVLANSTERQSDSPASDSCFWGRPAPTIERRHLSRKRRRLLRSIHMGAPGNCSKRRRRGIPLREAYHTQWGARN